MYMTDQNQKSAGGKLEGNPQQHRLTKPKKSPHILDPTNTLRPRAFSTYQTMRKQKRFSLEWR
jgi:hypothetical protein